MVGPGHTSGWEGSAPGFSEMDVLGELAHLKSNKVKGPEDVHPRDLKELYVTGTPQTDLCIQTLLTGDVPEMKNNKYCSHPQ